MFEADPFLVGAAALVAIVAVGAARPVASSRSLRQWSWVPVVVAALALLAIVALLAQPILFWVTLLNDAG